MEKTTLKSYQSIYKSGEKYNLPRWLYGFLIFLVVLLFLPWTQNIKSKGKITTINQENRAQEINSPIAGKVSKWWVKEGDLVEKGDTIAQISEIKAEYLDPALIARSESQLNAKKVAAELYQSKAENGALQVEALKKARALKLEQIDNKLSQLKNKLLGEQAELKANENEFQLAKDQFERQQKMFDQGLVSQTQLQQRSVAYQNASAKRNITENKLLQTQQELDNNRLERRSTDQDYIEKINKAEGERFASLSEVAGTQAEIAKLENLISNYRLRNDMYFIIAPQAGQVIQAQKAGLGEILKEGDAIAKIVPKNARFAVELFVRPVDLPLLSKGQRVRFWFDGFPAIVFSGWPQTSYGTFGGKVFAIESSISDNGLFRVLVAEDPEDRPWPGQLKLGGGAQGIALLKDVPVWYELWRSINGFPPDFYQFDAKSESKTEKK